MSLGLLFPIKTSEDNFAGKIHSSEETEIIMNNVYNCEGWVSSLSRRGGYQVYL